MHGKWYCIFNFGRLRNVCDLINRAARVTDMQSSFHLLPAFRPHLHSRAPSGFPYISTHACYHSHYSRCIVRSYLAPMAGLSSGKGFKSSREANRNLKHVRTAEHDRRIELRRDSAGWIVTEHLLRCFSRPSASRLFHFARRGTKALCWLYQVPCSPINARRAR
jgi:hypothetical protein